MEDWETYCERTSYSEKALKMLNAATQKLQAAQSSVSHAVDMLCEAMDSLYEQKELSDFYNKMEEISDMLDDMNVAICVLQDQM